MKKTALLLALLMLALALLAACGPGAPAESEASAGSSASPAESAEHSKGTEQSEEESKAPLVPMTEKVTYRTPVSVGCSYTVNVEADDKYADSYHSELTDGIYSGPESYSDGRTAGFAIGEVSALTLTIDLGKVYDNLYEFSVSYLHTRDAGIAPPSAVRVQTSVDGEEWTSVGVGKKPLTAPANTMQMCTVVTYDYVTARYVRFVVQKGSYWMFFDEFLVFADEEGNQLASQYLEKLIAAYEENRNGANEMRAARSALKGETVDRSKYRNEVSLNCAYSLSRNADSTFPNKDKMLTDGNVGKVLESETWVGFDGASSVDITIDLATVRTDLAEFAVYAYSNQSSILFPVYVTVAVGENPENMREIGSVYGPSDVAQTAYTYILSLDTAVKGRYVRFTVKGAGSGLMLLEECGAYAYGEKPDLPYLYPPVTLKKEKDKYWQVKSSEATKVQNLILGLPVQIIGGFASSAAALTNNTPVTSRLLTDGKMARGVDIHEGDFFKFSQGGERNVIFDLTALSTVLSFRASILSYADWAVHRPSSVTVYLSDDTENWYEAGDLSFASDAADRATNWGELKLVKPIAARYVCFSFDAGTWSASDEMEVYGTKSVAKNALRLASTDMNRKTMVSDKNDWKYTGQSSDLLNGSGDICLMYHGTGFSYSEDELLPYVAYLDKEGNIKDTMFDGFLFLLSGNFPSGEPGHRKSRKSDWEWLVKDLFAEGKNLTALDAVAGKVNEALGTPDRKYNVFATLYYLRPEVTAFGDVDGDGTDENLSILSDRMKVFSWFMDSVDKAWQEAGFEHLSFGGYYWYHEEISNSEADPDEAAMIKGAAAIAHERGTQFFWIPWYSAPGYTKWASFGFDVACMQPNYAFDASVLENRLDMATSLIQSLGMCLEMEIDDKALANPVFYDKYMGYLMHGVTDGYMREAIHMYYQGRLIFGSACASDSEKIRAIYDYTYLFIKKNLPEKPEAAKAMTFECSAGKPLTGVLGESGKLRAHKVYVSPEHGEVSINEDGSFVYYPDPGYLGEDTFSYCYCDRLFYSDGCIVTIRVGEN